MRLLWDVLLAQHLEVYAGAGAGHLAGNRDDGEVVAVADFDHETVGVMEEELVYLDPAFFHHCPHVLDLHFLQLFLHSPHALALPTLTKKHIKVHIICSVRASASESFHRTSDVQQKK